MKVKHIIQRYFRIIGRLSNGKQASYDEIYNFLSSDLEITHSEEKLSFSKRTFQRELIEIEELLNIKIKWDSYTKKYYISDNNQNNEINKVAQTLNILSYQKHFENFGNLIAFDINKNVYQDFINTILVSIKQKTKIEFIYKKFNLDNSESRILSPLGLKEYIGNWYILGLDEYKNEIRIFGLDRILKITVLPNKFIYPENFDINDYFNSFVGVTKKNDASVEIIKIKISNKLSNFLLQNPIHKSQILEIKTQEYSTFKFKLIINNEFINKLLLYSEDLEILKPIKLRTKLLNIGEKLVQNNYDKN